MVQVIAHIPSPGDPALPLVVGDDIFEGTYTSATSNSHSKLFEFSASGTLLRTFAIAGQTASPYGIQAATTDAAGDLVVLDDTSGRVLLLDPKTGATTLYATIPNIPDCGSTGASAECSNALTDQTPEPDYAAWGPDGSLYITDYQQAVIWRIPPHGGTPQVWLSSAQLDGEIYGTAGIWMEPDHDTLLFDQASSMGDLSEDMATGKLYSVQIEPNGEPGPLHLLWQSGAATLPDGFALTTTGDIYMAQIGPTGNDIVELSPDGALLHTFGTPVSGQNGSAIPFDEPSGVAFMGSELVIANQAYLDADTAHMALLGLGTGQQGAQVYVPSDAGPAVARHRSAKHRSTKKHKKKKHKKK